MKRKLTYQNQENARTIESSDLSEGAMDNIPLVNVRKKRRKKKIISIVVVLAIIIGGGIFSLKVVGKQKGNSGSKYTTETVTSRTIIDQLSVSGTLAPADSYTVSTLNQGKIITDKHNEGDKVKKGDTLYTIDSTDATNAIARAKVNLSNAQLTYKNKLASKEDLNVKSSIDGTVTDIAVEVGDKIKSGQTVATVVNSSTMSIVLPFLSADAQKFKLGEKATLTLNGSYENITGKISKISNVDKALSNFQVVRYVTIDVLNKGALSDTTTATAVVAAMQSTAASTFAYKAKAIITAAADGTVSQINTAEGNKVSRHQILVTMTSSSLDQDIVSARNAVNDASLALTNDYSNLSKYTITSPISGTIVEKNCKAGDTVQTGASLCTIYDLSYLSVTINVDELDITSVKTGQSATITTDAVANKTYTGIVTKIGNVGTTSSGVTTYPVTIKIAKTTGIRAGMNVTAKIIIAQRNNVVTVPADAVKRDYRILVKRSNASIPKAGSKSDIPAGFVYVQITTGISNDNYVEITKGLNKGDVIAYIKPTTSTSSNQPGFMGGGTPPSGGGGAPSGGGPGGGPGGGN